jgi:hypothetical protein
MNRVLEEGIPALNNTFYKENNLYIEEFEGLYRLWMGEEIMTGFLEEAEIVKVVGGLLTLAAEIVERLVGNDV